MARNNGEKQPLTAAAGNGSTVTSNTHAASHTARDSNSSSSINDDDKNVPSSSSPSSAGAAAAAAGAPPPTTTYGAVSGLVDENGTSNLPHDGGCISLSDVYEERAEGRGDRRTPRCDADDEAARNASAVLDAMETDSAKGVHNPLLYLATEELSAFNPYDHPHRTTLPKLANEEEGLRVPYRRDDSGGAFHLTFRGRSPKFTRFGVLLLITLLPFGAHFAKSCFSSLETYFLQDPELHFNATKYGSVMSAISVPNLFMPFFGGMFLDAKGHKHGIVLFLMIELIGHVMFTLAMGCDNFWLAFAGEALHGLGSGTVVVAMRSVVSKFFLENELTFALGVTVAGACVSKTLAKASVAPIAETSWGYMGALWYVGLWQVLSLFAGVLYVRVAKSAHNHAGIEMDTMEHKDLRPRSLLMALKRSTLSFWLVAILHTLFNLVYHLFANYSGHFLFENYDVSPVLAGYISALMPLVVVLCAPIAGLILDRWGRQLFVLLLANTVTIFAYFLLIQERAGAVLCIVMLALCESFVPTILLSALPLTVHRSVYGAAFGMAEVLGAVASISSTVLFGYSRDKTASYKQDLSYLVVLGFVCLAMTLFLTIWDARRGWSVLNRPGHVSGSEAMRGH